MARIEPFRALRYNPDKIKNLNKVMAPGMREHPQSAEV